MVTLLNDLLLLIITTRLSRAANLFLGKLIPFMIAMDMSVSCSVNWLNTAALSQIILYSINFTHHQILDS